MSDLEERLEKTKRESEWATSWNPDPGETLVGRFVKMDTAETQYGEADVAHVRDEDGQLRGVWLSHAVLRDKWEEKEPTPGDRIGVLYLGKREGSEFDYHHYELEVERFEETDTADRSPEEPERDAPEFEGDELFRGKDESSLDDPNGGLPY